MSTLGEFLEVSLKHDHHTHEYRFLHINGKYRWMRDELKLVRDDKNNPQEITCHKIARHGGYWQVGYWINITECKEIEEAFRFQSGIVLKVFPEI